MEDDMRMDGRSGHAGRWSAIVATLGLALYPAFACGNAPASAAKREAPPADPPAQVVAAAPAAAPAASPAPQAGALPSLASLVDTVKSSVVNVEVRSRAGGQAQMNDQAREYWERFFGGPLPESRPREDLRRGVGSGFIVSAEGLAITNNHVVDGAVTISVRLEDGRQFDAEVLGRDPLTDVAVIKLKGKLGKLPFVKLGDSDALRVGDWVVAIGNPFGLASTVSAGIISARAREIGAGPYDDFLQTDAAINPGNSGGPLFNLAGEVIGMNTAIVGGGTGIGFAVPSNLIKALVPQLEKDGVVTRGYLGVSVQNLTPEIASGLGVPVREGALVADVSKGSPSEEAGLKPDDVVVGLDGEAIGTSGQLTRRVALKRPGSIVTLAVYRGDQKLEKKVKLGTRPDLEGLGLKGRGTGAEDQERHEKLGLVVRDSASMPPGLQARRGEVVPGAVVVEVRAGSAAERADLRPGMVIVEAGGKPVKSAADLHRALREAKVGSTVLLRIQAGEGRLLRAVTIPE
jgi:serine protease Do